MTKLTTLNATGRGKGGNRKPSLRPCALRLLVLLCLLAGGVGTLVYSNGPGVARASIFQTCAGDCDANEQVTVDEIILIVNIILGTVPISSCPIFAEPPDVSDVVLAINAALSGCPPLPTATPSATPFPTLTPVVFQAGEGSRIFYSEGGGVEPIEEPLSGNFTIRLLRQEPQFFILDVTEVDLGSLSFSVVAQTPGHTGQVRMGSACPSLAFISLQVSINGEGLNLAGTAGISSCPPDIATVEPFEICTIRPASCDAIRSGMRAGYSLEIIPAVTID